MKVYFLIAECSLSSTKILKIGGKVTDRTINPRNLLPNKKEFVRKSVELYTLFVRKSVSLHNY